MKYVGRFDNGSGYMEWAGRPVDSVEEAKAQLLNMSWADVDVIEVDEGKGREGKIVASARLGYGWDA